MPHSIRRFSSSASVGNDPVAGNPVAGDKGAAASADDVPLAALGSQPRQLAPDVVLMMPRLR